MTLAADRHRRTALAKPDTVHLAFERGVATIVLDAPDTRNALSEALVAALRDRLQRALAHPGLRVLLLGHTGPCFCSGADLREQRRAGGPGVAGLVPVLQALWDAPVPVVARVGGHVRGGGMGLVAAADLAVAADTASFAFSEVHLGVAPAVVSVVCLRKLAPAAAAEAFLTGGVMSAERALAIGLVHRLAPPAELDRAVADLVEELWRGGPRALGQAKRILHREPGASMAADFAEMAELSGELFGSAEAQEGVAAFLERRPPGWARR